MSALPAILYEFGPYCLDPALPLLMREGRPVPLPPKALETLVALAASGGRVVTREELIEAVWPDTVVEENNLSVNISILRKALGGGSGGEKYIETVPRRGYRFTAPVRERPAEIPELVYTRHTRSQTLIEETVETGAPPVVAPAPVLDVTPRAARADIARRPPSVFRLGSFGRGPLVITVVLVIAALAAGAALFGRGWRREGASASGQRGAVADMTGGAGVRTLAVLPFRNATGGYGARDASAAGELTDAVVARLAAAGDVNVTPQGAVLAERMTPNNLLIAGRSLGADAVLAGTLFGHDAAVEKIVAGQRRAASGAPAEGGPEIHLRLHLVSTGGGEVLWAETFRQPREDLPALLDSIARGVSGGLQRLAGAEEYEQRANRHTSNREAYQLYLQGRFLWEQRHDVFAPTHDQLKDATPFNLLEQARALDPNFALAYVGLADHYKNSSHSSGTWQRAEEYAQRAVALDPNLAEPHATLGFIRMFHYWDWAGAEREFRRALEINPSCVTAHQWRALFHALRDNRLEALMEITRARELAPYSYSILIDMAEIRFFGRDYNHAINSLHDALILHPNSDQTRDLLFRAYWIWGTPEALQDATELRGDWRGAPPDLARHLAGPGKDSRDFDSVPPSETYYRARWHARFGHREEALDLLERAYREHHFFLIYLKVDPFFDSLRDEPRFQELAGKVGLDH